MRRMSILVAGLSLLSLSAAQAKFTTLYTFTGGNDGAGPDAPLVMDQSGNLYGTTFFGGADGFGAVFQVAPGGAETVLHAFKGGSDGVHPAARLLLGKNGSLYGTTVDGGGNGCGGNGCGTVFAVAPDGTETVLHAFKGKSDGANPFRGVVQDASGNIYGTATYGAVAGCSVGQGCGVVFKLTTRGKDKVLYTFQGGKDGGNPNSDLIRDESGDLFGAASWGGNAGNDGVIFKLAGGGESVLHHFSSKALSPAGLSMDGAGNLYTTVQGGRHGHGAVFKLAPDGTGGLVYSFRGGSDGDTPLSGVIVDAGQNLYGVTLFGGGNGCGSLGCGTVFKIAPDGTETVLHAFKNTNGGAVPVGLVMGRNGVLYGATYEGGANGFGTVFKLSQ